MQFLFQLVLVLGSYCIPNAWAGPRRVQKRALPTTPDISPAGEDSPPEAHGGMSLAGEDNPPDAHDHHSRFAYDEFRNESQLTETGDNLLMPLVWASELSQCGAAVLDRSGPQAQSEEPGPPAFLRPYDREQVSRIVDVATPILYDPDVAFARRDPQPFARDGGPEEDVCPRVTLIPEQRMRMHLECCGNTIDAAIDSRQITRSAITQSNGAPFFFFTPPVPYRPQAITRSRAQSSSASSSSRP